MSSQIHTYVAPPRERTDEGHIRRVGIEVEYGGIGVRETVPLVRAVLGGDVLHEDLTEAVISVPELGDFRVEIDSTLFKDQRILGLFGLESDDGESLSPFAETVEGMLVRVASGVIPHELITPPIPWNVLHRLDPLWEKLPEAGARGTHESILYAFGLHLNIEVPDLRVETLVAYLRAYLLLEEWIREQAQIDWTRRAVLPYIDPFGESYRRKVLNPDYAPTMARFIEDYLEDNPTRNRSLDLLPIIATVDPEAIRGRVEQEHLVRARPAFHYRLPNSELGRPQWSPAIDWNRWVQVEELAGLAPHSLLELSHRWLRSAAAAEHEHDDGVPLQEH